MRRRSEWVELARELLAALLLLLVLWLAFGRPAVWR